MFRSLVLVAALALMPTVSHAHDAADATAPMASSIKAEFHAMLKDAETKLIELAEATPADKFAYSPGNGVRSTSEVFMHVAGANYLIPTYAGVKAPEGMDPRKFEKEIKDKDAALKMLRESFVNAHAAIDQVNDLDTKIKMFGMDMTKRYALLLMVAHAHEHLGQSIAYARVNGITPPWTARNEAAAADAAAKKAAGGK